MQMLDKKIAQKSNQSIDSADSPIRLNPYQELRQQNFLRQRQLETNNPD